MKTTGYVAVLSLSLLSITAFSGQSLSTPPATAMKVAQKININTATASELLHRFRGIGQKRAEAIVAYRDKHGPFKSIATLAEVKGIGQSFVSQHLDAMRAVFTVE